MHIFVTWRCRTCADSRQLQPFVMQNPSVLSHTTHSLRWSQRCTFQLTLPRFFLHRRINFKCNTPPQNEITRTVLCYISYLDQLLLLSVFKRFFSLLVHTRPHVIIHNQPQRYLTMVPLPIRPAANTHRPASRSRIPYFFTVTMIALQSTESSISTLSLRNIVCDVLEQRFKWIRRLEFERRQIFNIFEIRA